MDFLTFIFLALFLAYLIYILFDESDNDLLHRRLHKFSQHKEQKKDDEEHIKNNLKEKLLELAEPLISSFIRKRKDTKSLKQLLLEAGQPSGDEDVFKFMAQKIMWGFFGLVIASATSVLGQSDSMTKMLTFMVCSYAFYRYPDFIIKAKISKRAEEISYNLPDALDLLTVCVEAGLGLDAALSRVSQEQARTSPILARELSRVSKDILAGVQRQEAFRNLASRNNVEELKTFAALLIQTDKLGTSISQSLRVYSDSVRTKRRQRVEALAAKASVKMIIPMVLFILPAMFVVLLAPAAIKLVENFKGMGN